LKVRKEKCGERKKGKEKRLTTPFRPLLSLPRIESKGRGKEATTKRRPVLPSLHTSAKRRNNRKERGRKDAILHLPFHKKKTKEKENGPILCYTSHLSREEKGPGRKGGKKGKKEKKPGSIRPIFRDATAGERGRKESGKIEREERWNCGAFLLFLLPVEEKKGVREKREPNPAPLYSFSLSRGGGWREEKKGGGGTMPGGHSFLSISFTFLSGCEEGGNPEREKGNYPPRSHFLHLLLGPGGEGGRKKI